AAPAAEPGRAEGGRDEGGGMKEKVVSAEAAAAIVHDGDTICTSGFVGVGTPDGLLAALEKRFVETGTPRNLTLLFAAGQGGGRINERTTEDLVRLMEIDGEEWLFYRAFPIQVALLRGTTADTAGNVTMEREALTLDNLAMAMAARNSKGFVVVQVERIAAA